MKNNIYKIILLLNFFLISLNANGQEQFNFSVTEIEILENGNKFIGKDRGVITSNDGIEIDADKFEYNKKKNILKASGNVKIIDTTNNYEIYTQNIIYKKNNNFIITNNPSKAIDLINGIEINAEVFKYDVNENIYNILNNYFGNLSLLSKTGLRKVFNLLKEEVINNKLIGLILYGTNINEQHNRLFGFYTTVQNSKIKLTVKSICIYLIKDYIGRKNVEALCEETPNFNIYYKCD